MIEEPAVAFELLASFWVDYYKDKPDLEKAYVEGIKDAVYAIYGKSPEVIKKERIFNVTRKNLRGEKEITEL